MGNCESPREHEAVVLRKWFESQKRFGSWAAMERALNITKDYLHLIKSGKRRAVDPELRGKLYGATGLEIFKPIPRDLGSEEQGGKRSLSQAQKTKIQNAKRRITEPSFDLPGELTFALRRLGLTISGCATRYGISPNMLKKYKRGAARPSSEKNVVAILNILKDAQKMNSVLQTKPGENEFERAARVKKLLVMLADELEFFKQNSESLRETFRRVVPGEDVGYITTLLRALYNEDQFQRWLLFSKYRMKSKEELRE